MILAALSELGLAALAEGPCMSKACFANIERASRNISRIDWKPLTVFPEEARRFSERATREHPLRLRRKKFAQTTAAANVWPVKP
jgi:hypothetical protein